MVENITSAVTGILSAIETLLNPVIGSGANPGVVAWGALLALPVAGGVVTLGKRLVKKAR